MGEISDYYASSQGWCSCEFENYEDCTCENKLPPLPDLSKEPDMFFGCGGNDGYQKKTEALTLREYQALLWLLKLLRGEEE